MEKVNKGMFIAVIALGSLTLVAILLWATMILIRLTEEQIDGFKDLTLGLSSSFGTLLATHLTLKHTIKNKKDE